MSIEWKSRYFWLNAADGVRLAIDRFLGREECGHVRPDWARLVCDRPKWHSGNHEARAFVSPFHR